MNKPHIVMFLSNAFKPDPRVYKEARSLVNTGYKVTIICWDREKKYPRSEIIDGINIERISIQSGYGIGSKQIFYLPKFWQLALKKTKQLEPDIIHCHDLDTTPIGYLYAQHHHIPWIFDAHECYPEQMKKQVNVFIYYFLLWLERIMVKKATYVITVGELLAQRFRKFGGNVSIVGNYAHRVETHSVRSLSRSTLNIPPKNLIVTYIGGFTPGRLIIPLIYATEFLSNVTVLLVGDGHQRSAIEAELLTHPQVIYIGAIPLDQVPAYTALSDVMYYGLNSHNNNNYYSTPNALFNAIIAGKPILTTNVGEIAQIVRTNNCGIVVDDATPQSLAKAIKKLKNNTLRQELATNAFNLAQSKYHWAIAEHTLQKLYANLLTENTKT